MLGRAEAHFRVGERDKALGLMCAALWVARFHTSAWVKIGRSVLSALRESSLTHRLRYFARVWLRARYRELRESIEAARVRSKRSLERPRVVYLTGLPRTGTSLMKNYLGDAQAFYVMRFQPDGFFVSWREARSRDEIVLDKATHYLRSLRKIYRAYGGAVAFCCIVRDPRDQFLSLLNLPNIHREVPRNRRFWKYWSDHYQRYLDFAAQHPDVRCFLLRYEDLVRHPQQAKRQFIEWLGVSLGSDTITDKYKLAHSDDIQDPKVATRSSVTDSSVGKWEYCKDARVRELQVALPEFPQATDLMRRLGYDRDGYGRLDLDFPGVTTFCPALEVTTSSGAN